MTKNKFTDHEVLCNEELSEVRDQIANRIGDRFYEAKDLSKVDLHKVALEVFEENTTSTIAALMKLNKTFTKDQISYAFTHLAEQLCLMGLALKKASELDY